MPVARRRQRCPANPSRHQSDRRDTRFPDHADGPALRERHEPIWQLNSSGRNMRIATEQLKQR